MNELVSELRAEGVHAFGSYFLWKRGDRQLLGGKTGKGHSLLLSVDVDLSTAISNDGTLFMCYGAAVRHGYAAGEHR
jgi:hypothetical protein